MWKSSRQSFHRSSDSPLATITSRCCFFLSLIVQSVLNRIRGISNWSVFNAHFDAYQHLAGPYFPICCSWSLHFHIQIVRQYFVLFSIFFCVFIAILISAMIKHKVYCIQYAYHKHRKLINVNLKILEWMSVAQIENHIWNANNRQQQQNCSMTNWPSA